MAQTQKMATGITGRPVEGGTTSEIAGLESAEITRMPVTRTNICGGSVTQDISLSCLDTVLLTSSATIMMTTGMASMKTEDYGIMSILLS